MPRSRHKKGKPSGAKPGNKGMSPETWESICKVLPGIIKAVADLIEALRLH